MNNIDTLLTAMSEHRNTEGGISFSEKPQREIVLVVDDEVPILESISDLLEDDFDIITASNAREALVQLEQHEVAVILSDQRMPGMTGDEFLKEAQKRSEATRVLITGYTDMEALVRAVNNGQIYAYLSKPWEPEELSVTIAKAADHYELVRQLTYERNLLHALMDNIPDAIYFKDANAKFIRLNLATAKMLGIEDPEQAIGKTREEFLDKNTSREGANEETELLEAGTAIVDQIVKYTRPDGSNQWISITKAPIRDHAGNIAGLVGISRDITARRQMEEQLRLIHEATAAIAQSPELSEALKNVLGIVCEATGSTYGEVWLPNAAKSELRFSGVTWDTTGTLENFVRLSENLTFLPGAGLPGKIWSDKDVRHERDLNTPHHFTRASIANKAGLQSGFGIPIVDANEVLAIMIFLSNHIPPNIETHIELAKTLTRQLGSPIRRKQAETALRESEKRLETLISHLPDGVCLLDTTCRIVLANPTAWQHLKVLGIRDTQKAIASLGNIGIDTLLTDRADGLPHELSAEGEKPRLFELTSAPIPAADTDEESGYALLIRDVTEERATRERIQNQYRLSSVGQLAAGIAHDFNNVLTVMMGSAQLLTLNEEVDEKVGDDLRLIYEQGQRAAEMVRQVLDFSRESKAERRPTNMIPFMKEATKLLTRAMPGNVEIHTVFEVSSCTVEANLTQIQQVVNNMAINAQHAMPDGGDLTIAVSTLQITPENLPAPEMQPGEWFTIAISDTGHGIPQDVLGRIFDPFFTTKDPGEGTGLGLAQSYGIVQEHGGYITVDTEIGKGTIFTVYLPVNKKTAAKEQVDDADIPRGHGETILLVEDQESVRRVTSVLLENLNYKVVTATNGLDGLDIFASGAQPIDLIITDVTMPKLNGLELAKIVRASAPDLPIVMMSGYISQDKWNQYASFTSAHIDKPLDMNQLARILAALLQN